MKKTFVKRLTELLENANMSQTELAQRIGTTDATVSRYINGERLPKIESLIQIASVFNVSLDYLFGLPGEENVHFIKNDSVVELYKILNQLNFLNDEHNLSNQQIVLIRKLLEANKDFILALKNNTQKNN